ncbi:MAG: hypothetical protein WBP56_04840 [Polyangia bacterium]
MLLAGRDPIEGQKRGHRQLRHAMVEVLAMKKLDLERLSRVLRV